MPLVAVIITYLFLAVLSCQLQQTNIALFSIGAINTGLLSYGVYRNFAFGFEPVWEPILSIVLMIVTVIYYSILRIKQVDKMKNNFIT